MYIYIYMQINVDICNMLAASKCIVQINIIAAAGVKQTVWNEILDMQTHCRFRSPLPPPDKPSLFGLSY